MPLYFYLKLKQFLTCDVINKSFADSCKLNSSLILISFLTDLTPSVSQASFVNFNFSSGLSTFPVKKILPSKTFAFTEKNNFYLIRLFLLINFFALLNHLFVFPTDLGSKATDTPVPKRPFEETPIQLDKNQN